MAHALLDLIEAENSLTRQPPALSPSRRFSKTCHWAVVLISHTRLHYGDDTGATDNARFTGAQAWRKFSYLLPLAVISYI